MRSETIVHKTFSLFIREGPSGHARILLIERPAEKPQVVTNLKLNIYYLECFGKSLSKVLLVGINGLLIFNEG